MKRQKLDHHPSPHEWVTDLSMWWNDHADRVDDDGSLLISVKALGAISDIMSDSPLPRPMVFLSHGGFGEKELTAQMEHFFARRCIPFPSRRGKPRVGATRKPFSTSAFTMAEIFEWIWDCIAIQLDSHINSTLPSNDGITAKIAKSHGIHYTERRESLRSNYHSASSTWPPSDAHYQRSAELIIKASAVGYADNLEVCDSGRVLSVVTEACLSALGVEPDIITLRDHIQPLYLSFKPTTFLGNTILRCDILEHVLGKSLASALRRTTFDRYWGVCSEVTDDRALIQMALQEMLDTRASLLELRSEVSAGKFNRAREVAGPSMVLTTTNVGSRMHQRLSNKARLLYEQVCLVFRTNTAFIHTGEIWSSIWALATGDADHASGFQRDAGKLVSHSLTCMDAIDEYIKAGITQACECTNEPAGEQGLFRV